MASLKSAPGEPELWGAVDLNALSSRKGTAGSFPPRQYSVNSGNSSREPASPPGEAASPSEENPDAAGSESEPLLRRASSTVESRRPFQYQPIRQSSSGLGSSHAPTYQRYRYYSKLAPANQPNGLILPSHVLPASLFTLSGSEGEQSSFITILSIWNTMMGSSVLAMPWAIDQAGFSLGIVAMIVMCGLALYTCLIVLDAGCGGRLNGLEVEFPDVCLHYLGRNAYVVAVIFSVLTLMGACMVYWVLMSGFLFTVVDYFHDPSAGNTTSTDVTAWEPTGTLHQGEDHHWHKVWNKQLVPIYLVILLFPLINFKSLTFFTKFNSLGIFSIAYVIFFVLFTVSAGENYENSPAGGIHFEHIEEGRTGVLSLCGVASLAFFIHNGCLSIMRNQRKPENNRRDLTIGYGLVCMTYLLVGVGYFLAYQGDKSKINNNLLQDFDKSAKNFIFALVAQIFLLVQMISVYPLLLFIVRFQVMSTFFGGNVYPSFWHVLALNTVTTVVCVLVAVFYPHIGDILRYTGALCGCVYVFTLPALLKMKIEHEKGTLTTSSKVLHYGLIVIGFVILAGQFVPS